MRTFAEIQQAMNLKKWLESPLGTLYLVDDAGRPSPVLVRRFDRELPPTAVQAYANLVSELDEWLAARPDLAQLAKVEQPTEVGTDFVARPYHLYFTSTRSYTRSEDPLQPPPEFETMQRLLRRDFSRRPMDLKESVLRRVLARSLLEPTSKTFYNEPDEQFVVVDPVLTREDVEEWARLTGM